MENLTPPEIHEAISRQRLQMLDQLATQQAIIGKMRVRIAELEAENAALKKPEE
jgi:hypothetical protein